MTIVFTIAATALARLAEGNNMCKLALYSLAVFFLFIKHADCIDERLNEFVLRNLLNEEGKLSGDNFSVERASLIRDNQKLIHIIQIRDQLTGRIKSSRYLDDLGKYLNGKYTITKEGELSDDIKNVVESNTLGSMTFDEGILRSEDNILSEGKVKRTFIYNEKNHLVAINFMTSEKLQIKKLDVGEDGFIFRETVWKDGAIHTEDRSDPVKITSVNSGIEWSSVVGKIEANYGNVAPYEVSFNLTFSEKNWSLDKIKMTFSGLLSSYVVESDCAESAEIHLKLFYGMSLNSIKQLIKIAVEEYRKKPG